jgi:predicted nucleic acid-binding protein
METADCADDTDVMFLLDSTFSSCEAEKMEARSLIDSIEAFGERDAHVAADLFKQTGRRSRSLPDCMIAALAIRCGAALAAINSRDFRRVAAFGLKLL